LRTILRSSKNSSSVSLVVATHWKVPLHIQ
jgi:hypothetical protein